MTPVGFGPTQFAIVELKLTPLDHWGAGSPAEEGVMCIRNLRAMHFLFQGCTKMASFWINPPLLGAYTGWTDLRCYQMCYHSRRAFESLASITGRVDIAPRNDGETTVWCDGKGTKNNELKTKSSDVNVCLWMVQAMWRLVCACWRSIPCCHFEN